MNRRLLFLRVKRDVANGFFITEDRFVVRGVRSRLMLQRELSQNKTLQVRSRDASRKALVRRFIGF